MAAVEDKIALAAEARSVERRGQRQRIVWLRGTMFSYAADTAFLDNHKGAITLNKLEVTAVVDGDLPKDSIDRLVSIG